VGILQETRIEEMKKKNPRWDNYSLLGLWELYKRPKVKKWKKKTQGKTVCHSWACGNYTRDQNEFLKKTPHGEYFIHMSKCGNYTRNQKWRNEKEKPRVRQFVTVGHVESIQ
jgi:hypothetical protein